MHRIYRRFFTLLVLGDNPVTNGDGMCLKSLNKSINMRNYAKNTILKKTAVLKGLIKLIIFICINLVHSV